MNMGTEAHAESGGGTKDRKKDAASGSAGENPAFPATPNDGGPAFPNGPAGDMMQYEDGHINHQFAATAGMSLRDYFAAHALQGILAGLFASPHNKGWTVPGNVVGAYEYADDMIEYSQKTIP